MTVIQSTYTEAFAKGYPGMPANMEPGNRISKTCEDAAGIAFGAPCFRGAGDRGCTGVFALVGAGSESASNAANTGTITDAPDVAPPAKLGRYTITIVEPASDAGQFVVEDPDGITIGYGTVAVEFVGGGLTFTVADGSQDFVAGEQLFVDVTGSEFLGVAIAHKGLPPLPSGVAADIYPRYESVTVMVGGGVYVTVGGDVTDGADVQLNAAGEYVAAGGSPVGNGWQFDETVADTGVCRIVRR